MHRRQTILVGCICVLLTLTWFSSKSAVARQSPTVTPANWYWAPYNRWSWQHTRRIFPSANISRGNGAVSLFVNATRNLSEISFLDPVSRTRMTIPEMLAKTYTDGFIVLKDGKVVSEQYFNGMRPDNHHLLMSVTKSVVGTLAGILVAKGELRPAAFVTHYLPKLRHTVYGKATVREVLDMTVSAWINPKDPYGGDDQAAGWIPPGPNAAPGLRAYLRTMTKKEGPDGVKFEYLDPSALVISEIIERITHEDFAKVLQNEIWSKLGARHNAYVLLDHYQEAYTTPGLNTTLTDLARFGQMMEQDGFYNGQQIVPRRWVRDIRKGGSTRAWLASNDLADRALPGYAHGSYRDFWWVSQRSCGRFAAIGLGGQVMVVDPIANMVVVKISSPPSPGAGEEVIRTTFSGINAIIRALSGHGC